MSYRRRSHEPTINNDEVVQHCNFPNVCSSVKRLMLRIPLDIQNIIINKTSVVFLLCYMENNNRAHQRRFEEVCWNNDITSDINDSFVFRFKRFLCSFQNMPLLKGWTEFPLRACNASLDFETSGQSFYYIHDEFDELLTYSVTLHFYKPMNQEGRVRPRTRVFDYQYRDNVGDHVKVYYRIGNRRELHMAGSDWRNRPKNKIRLKLNLETRSVAFDDEDNLYFHRGSTFFRRSLLTADSDEKEMFNIIGATDICGYAVANSKSYVCFFRNIASFICCYDLRLNKLYERSGGFLHDCKVAAHGNSCVVYDGYRIAAMFTLNNEVLLKQDVICERLVRLNRDTYIAMVDKGAENELVKTVSIVNNEIIEHFVQYSDSPSVFYRQTDNIFVVCERHHRYIWFQEKPEDEPYLVHFDDVLTNIETDRSGYKCIFKQRRKDEKHKRISL